MTTKNASTKAVALTAAGVQQMLRRHYNPPSAQRPGFILAAEIAAPGSDRRADLIAAPLTHSNGDHIIGHEIKVNRQDVISELRNPTKHDDWAKHCSQWWLVISDPALIEGLTIPESWGIMAPPVRRGGVSMAVLRPAPKLSPIDTGAAWRKLARWQAWKSSEAEREAARSVKEAQRTHERDQRELARVKAVGTGAREFEAERIHRILNLVDEQIVAKRLWLWARTEDQELLETIADAVVDHVAVRSAATNLRSSLANIVEELIDPKSGVRLSLSKADVLAAPKAKRQARP